MAARERLGLAVAITSGVMQTPLTSSLLSLIVASVVSPLAACGTYSQIRTGKTLPAGAFELSAGVAANGVPEVNPVVQGALGISDRVEAVAHYELQNAYGELRVGLLKEESQGLNLAWGVGGGFGGRAGDDLVDDGVTNPLLTTSLAVSRSIGELVELYVAGRATWLVPDFSVLTARGGLRVGKKVFFYGEGGVSIHDGFPIGEGTGGIGIAFGE